MKLSHLFLSTVSFALFRHGDASSPPVKVVLRSSWPAPPTLVEIIETVSLENVNAFFPYLDALTNPEILTITKDATPEAIYRATLQVAVDQGLLSGPGSLASVEMNLALHSATPKVEAFYEHYADHYGGQNSSDLGSNCGSWIDWYGKVVCDVETLAGLAGIETIDPVNNTAPHISYNRPKILTFDHIYPASSGSLPHPPRTAILYGSLTSSNFRDLHTYLLSLAGQPSPHVEYVFRHIPPAIRDHSERNYLSGYGVALDLKKMEYLAVDDRNSERRAANDTESADTSLDLSINNDPVRDHLLSLLEAYPENTTASIANLPLTDAELLEIGLQAAQLISDSDDPLRTMTYISQNFPKYATSIARRVVVNASLDDEVQDNQVKAQGGINMFWLNGAHVPEKDVNPFALLRLLRKERGVSQSLTSLGLTQGQAIELLTHPAIAAAQVAPSVLDGIFDASDRPENGGVITWWNNIERDSRYARWSPSITGLLRPLYPGQFHNIKLNLFNIVLVLDLSQSSSLHFLAGPVANIIERGYPFRFGIVPIAESEEGTRMARLFFYLVRRFGRKRTMGFIQRVSQFQIPIVSQSPTVDWDLVRAEYAGLTESEEGTEERPIADLEAVLGGDEEAEKRLLKTQTYTERLGATSAGGSQGHGFVNGKHFDMDDTFLRNLQMEVGQQLNYFQEQMYEGQLSDDNAADMSTYFYDLPSSNLRRNPHIYPAATSGSLRIFNLPDLFARTGFASSSDVFVYPPGAERTHLSLQIVADFDSENGLQLVKEALNSLDAGSLTRISFIHNPISTYNTERPSASWLISHLFAQNLLSKATPENLLRALGFTPAVTTDDRPQIPVSSESSLHKLTSGASFADFSTDAYSAYVNTSRLVVHELGIPAGAQALIINGRVIGPFATSEFVAADFKALENYENQKRTAPVVESVESIAPLLLDADRKGIAHIVTMLSSVVASLQLPDPSESGLFDTPPKPRTRNYRLLTGKHTSFEFGDNTTALYQVGVLLDPLSETAQVWTGMLNWLINVPDIFVEVHVNPARYREVPVKRFYRYNLSPSLSFDENGQEIAAQTVFRDLPVEPIYTLAMDVPSSWLVRPREASYDLDNIQLGSLSSDDLTRGVEAVFDLDYIVVEGHARETLSNTPPRGLQLQLTDSHSNPIDDTQVVANLGYLQFKAKPGVFQLEIRPGRGRDIYIMESVGNEGWNSPTVEEVGNEITVTSFEGLTLYPRLVRLPGKETDDVLLEISRQVAHPEGIIENVLSRVKSIFSPKKDTEPGSLVPYKPQADINIFTVASGLLYERFVSIMILSVLRNTKSTVKFWFIENFLSPSFLEFIPHLAEAYGFQYELVTYKWPSWLRAQKEKQRIIWAYKILFLDVLFPMDLKKVIFVDADQIVRADLRELVDLDLHGAPYGYTPMGDDNVDMEGFRFWKTGYWRDFLKGRPYHISALYVVDLVRFRQIAAGDILRGQYQQLSADPNSLANLDQDLPNNLQREVPIYSLHEDWLWCETWCSKDRLHRAKTIDLCQNPLTKEPKLARARQIPEWEEYDAEISRFARKLAEEGVIRSRIAAADANVLANAGVQKVDVSLESHLESKDSELPATGGHVSDEL